MVQAPDLSGAAAAAPLRGETAGAILRSDDVSRKQ